MNQKEYHRRAYELAKPAYAALMKFYPLTVDDLDGEDWQKLDEHYHVSNFGRTKSFYKGKVKILKPLFVRGYLHVALYFGGKPKHFQVHRLVAQAFISNPDNKPQVNHIDGNKLDNYVGNLEWATQSENTKHAYDTGLAPQGEEHGCAKLTNEQVKYIRTNSDNLKREQLAEKFGVAPTTISDIQLGKIWKNASGVIRNKIKVRVPDEVRNQIRADYATGNYTQRQLAKKYGVHLATIRRILSEK